MTVSRSSGLDRVADRLGFRRAKRPSKLRQTYRRRLSSERLEDRQLLAADIAITGSPWQNADSARDVNNDGQVTPLDAFVLVYDLTSNGPRSLPTSPAPPDVSEPYLDVDGDGSVSETDLNLVIDYLHETGQISDEDFYGGAAEPSGPSGASGPSGCYEEGKL